MPSFHCQRLLFSLLCLTVSASVGATKSANVTREVGDALWWLPPDTETLIVSRGPFRIVAPPREPGHKLPFEGILRQFPLSHVFIASEKRDHARNPFVGHSVLFAIEGARKFRPPARLGGALYEGCQIVKFASDSSDLDRLAKQVESIAQRVISIGGHTVWLKQEMMEQDLLTIYIARASPDTFLLATNEGYLTEVFQRMKKRHEPRAFPDDLPEWAQINQATDFWALRHYGNNPGFHDPASPYIFGAAMHEDRQAVGLACSYSARDGRRLNLTYLSNNSNAFSIAQQVWQGGWEGLRILHREKRKGVIEISIEFEGNEEDGAVAFLLFGSLGHAIAL